MNLITDINIDGLRSIQAQQLTHVGNLNVFVGRNSSGKSNALRALNMFFNGEIEPGKPVDFARDHYEQSPRRRKKKRISIRVSFRTPPNFHLRKELNPLTALGSEFSITRYWELDQLRRPADRLEVEVQGNRINGGEDIGRQFLSLITYRHIPNRTVPSAILRDESQAIASSIFGRMKGDQHASALLQALQLAAKRMLLDASESLSSADSPLSDPSVSTTDTINDMLVMGGFQAKGQHGLSVQDEDWGAGHQAFFLYQVLKALDTSYGRFFGWKQATIWGVEEPEAALHRDLETRLAGQFRKWCLDDDTKLQFFVTSHSPIFTMAADSGHLVELENGESRFYHLSIPELTHAADTRGVSGWVHPILNFPWNPVVLTEGPCDAAVLSHVARLAGADHLRFTSLPQLDPEENRGGKDKIISFLKNSLGLVKNRAKEYPLLVLLDWEVSDQDLKRTQDAYGPDGKKYVLRMNQAYCNPLISADFKGIERFYPPHVFIDAHQAGEIILGVQKGRPYSISKVQLDAGKHHLKQRVLKIDSLADLNELLHVLHDIEQTWRLKGQAQLILPGITP